jgi:hypothetical protein
VTSAISAPVEHDVASHSLIEEALRTFAKAFRAWQLYLPNNPTRERALNISRAAFTACWSAGIERIRLQVREAEFLHDGQPVLREVERPSDGIPWILYRDGFRELTIMPGFENDALDAMLALLQRARQAAPDDDDLVTMLWVADLESLHYRYVEVGSNYDGLLSPGGPAAAGAGAGSAEYVRPAPRAEALDDAPAFEAAPPAGVVRVEDFDSTLYFLDRRELAYLQEEVRAEFTADPRREVLAILFDIVEVQSDAAVRAEAIDRIDELMVNLLTTGTYDLVALGLREASETLRRVPEFDERARQRLLSLSDRLSEPGVIGQLLQAVDEGTRAPGAETLEALVSELRGGALAPLLSWVTHSSPGPARAAVERAVVGLAERQTGELVRLLTSDDASAALGAIRLSGRLRTTAAVPMLSQLVRTSDVSVRVEVVQALASIASVGAMQALEVALDDAERDVRVSALKAVGAQRHAGALARLTAALRKKELRTADRSEKTALFDAFGAVCGDAGVPALDAVLNARSLLGPKESPEMRACAARALGLVATESAFASLRKAADTRDAVVRNEVARALRVGGNT